jgi:hypothetical protein
MNKYKETFLWSYYFDAKHCIRWAFHLASSVLGYLTMPFFVAVFHHYVLKIDGVDLMFSGIVGFFGFDFWRVVEKLLFLVADKIGIPLEEAVTKRDDRVR